MPGKVPRIELLSKLDDEFCRININLLLFWVRKRRRWLLTLAFSNSPCLCCPTAQVSSPFFFLLSSQVSSWCSTLWYKIRHPCLNLPIISKSGNSVLNMCGSWQLLSCLCSFLICIATQPLSFRDAPGCGHPVPPLPAGLWDHQKNGHLNTRSCRPPSRCLLACHGDC